MATTLKLGDSKWATKDGSLLAYNDENGNFKPLPFNFTRATSGTVVNKEGLIEVVSNNVPRIDFSNDSNGALLLEPTRSNNLLQSNQFDTTWLIGGSALDLTSGKSGVYGSNDAWLLKKNSTGARYIQQSLSLSSAQYSYSVYLKAESTNWVLLLSYDGSTAVESYFDLENGVVGQTGGSNLDSTNIESVGNGWYRCTLTYTSPTNLVRIYPADANGSVSPTDDNGIYIQYAQLEVGSYATSYIPTSGSAVTRVADNAYQQNATQVIGQSEGTMFIEFTPKDSSTFQILYQAKSSSGVVGQVDIRLQDGLIRALANDGGGRQFFINGGSYTVGTKYKVAIRYKLNDSKLYINGTDSGSDTSCSFTGSSLDQVSFAESLYSFLPNIDLLDARLYNTALTDAELAALTS